jgi:hypothetical protein
MKWNRIGAFFILLAISSIIACTTEPDLTGVPEVKFRTDIQRIMSANCSFEGCHDGKDEGSLIGYDNVMSFGGVKAGDAHKSTLYRVSTGRSFEKMPPSGYNEVSADDLKLMYVWIMQGAKNN